MGREQLVFTASEYALRHGEISSMCLTRTTPDTLIGRTQCRTRKLFNECKLKHVAVEKSNCLSSAKVWHGGHA